MAEHLRILILQDNSVDAELVQDELHEAGLEFTARVVLTEKDYQHALRTFSPDLILSDCNLPQYSGRKALAETKKHCPDVPFILVTGAITEEEAIDMLTSGAKDFVMKHRLQKLMPAVRRSLEEAEDQRARKKAEEELREAHRTMEEQVKIRTAELEAEIAERKKLEEALRQERDFTSAVLETEGALVVVLNRQGRITRFNRACEDVTGYSAAEVQGRIFWEFLVPPEELAGVKATWDALTARIFPNTHENHWVAKDGSRRFISWSNTALTDRTGEIQHIVATGLDITERKQAEEALRQLNAELEQRISERTAELRAASLYARSLIEASLDPLVTISPDGKITDVNRATEQVTGRSREHLIGTDFSAYFTEPNAAQAGYLKVLAAGQVWDYPLAIRHSSGGATHVLYNATVYRNEQGEVQGVFAAARDVTDRKRAEEALKAERQRIYDVLDTLPVYVILLTSDHHIPFANRFFEERYGESCGRRCFEYLFNRTEPCEVCETYTVLKTNSPHCWEWTGPDGRNYDIFDFPFIDADGSTMIMEVGIDITERKKAEESLQKSHAELEIRVEERTRELSERTSQLEAAYKEMESFSYSVSHDLRAPLRAIDGFSRMLLKKYVDRIDDDATRRLNVICSNARKMGQLIDDLLSLSRLSRQALRRTQIDMTALVGDIWEEIQTEHPDRRIEFTVKDVQNGLGDQSLVRQVLVNLLSNAVKFTNERKPAVIEVSSYSKDGEVVYCVRDNGAGFDMQYGDKLFGVFQRLHAADEYEGTGVGLAIVQRIIHRHGGRVWAEGQIDEGARFYFTLAGTEARLPIMT